MDEKDSLTEKSGHPAIIEQGSKSIGTDDIQPQSTLSAVALQLLQRGQIPSKEANNINIKKDKKHSKILMLGISGAGKTTLLKSMTMCCEDSYGPAERTIFKEGIYYNLIEDIGTIFGIMKTFNIHLASKESHDNFRTVMKTKLPASKELPDDAAVAIKALWDDSGVQAGFRKPDGCRLNDSCGYFWENLNRITSPNYLPTNQDILQYRYKTIGITKKDFLLSNSRSYYNVWDVGGARKERRKWIHCIENLSIIIFSVDISAYDTGIFEDDKISVMQENLAIFDNICKSRWLREAVVLLCFNKVDALQRKLIYRPFDDYYEDFNGDRLNLEDVMTYMETKFMKLVDSKPKDMVQVCFTEMTDDRNLGKAVFEALSTCVKIKEFYDDKEGKVGVQATGCLSPWRLKRWLVSRFRR